MISTSGTYSNGLTKLSTNSIITQAASICDVYSDITNNINASYRAMLFDTLINYTTANEGIEVLNDIKDKLDLILTELKSANILYTESNALDGLRNDKLDSLITKLTNSNNLDGLRNDKLDSVITELTNANVLSEDSNALDELRNDKLDSVITELTSANVLSEFSNGLDELRNDYLERIAKALEKIRWGEIALAVRELTLRVDYGSKKSDAVHSAVFSSNAVPQYLNDVINATYPDLYRVLINSEGLVKGAVDCGNSLGLSACQPW